MNLRAATLTTALHALLVLPLACAAPPAALPIPEPAAPEDMPRPPLDVEFIEPGAGPACEGYDGIGIMHGFGGHVFEVAPGSPAAEAGIRAGDVLLDPFAELRLAAGSTVRLSLDRDGVVKHYVLVTRRICTS